MSRTWAFLTQQQHNKYIEKAESLNMTEGELTRRLILLYLNSDTDRPNCLTCPYYQVATSQLMKIAKTVNDFFLIVPPEKKG
jgi:hypothetical protein